MDFFLNAYDYFRPGGGIMLLLMLASFWMWGLVFERLICFWRMQREDVTVRQALMIMDNAAYHNVLSPVSAPTPACKKEKIRSWLERNNFPVKDDCLKAELVDLH